MPEQPDWRSVAAGLADAAEELLRYNEHMDQARQPGSSHGLRNIMDTVTFGGTMCGQCMSGRDHYVTNLREAVVAFDAAAAERRVS